MPERARTQIVIKRYGGARLYHTGAARYVTLEDIAELLRADREVAVYDAGTGEDVTQTVLAKIVAGYH